MNNFENYSVLSSVYYKENPEFLRLSMDSILNQTVPTDDYVIVKDGPLTDELDQVIKEYQIKYSNIHIVALPENVGLGLALNSGLQACKNELVARMDTDDISLPERCEKELQMFNADNNLDIVGMAIYEFSDSEDAIVSVKKMPISSESIKKYARRRNPFNHPTVMYKKSSVFAHGGYSGGQRGEDFELFTKMMFEGCKGANINEPYFKYRASANQFSRRTSILDTKAVINVVRNNYKKKYIGLNDYIFVIMIQIVGLLIPKSFGKSIYKKIFRSEYTTKNSVSDLYLVNTPYHLMLACNNCTKKDVLICAGKFKYTYIIEQMIQRTFGINFYKTHDFYYYTNDLKKLPSFRKNINLLMKEIKNYHFNDVYIYNDVDPIIQRIVAQTKWNGKVILTEEGIGLYRDTIKRHKVLFKAFGKFAFGRTYEEIDRIGESAFVNKIICSTPEKLSECQKMREIHLLERMDYQKLAKILGVSQYSGRNWFIGQPLVEDGVMTKKEYLSIVQKLLDYNKYSNEHQIIVKPHPREELDKYSEIGIEIIRSSEIPVELLIDSKEAISVLTFYSSSILSLATMKNIKTYALYKMTTAKDSLSTDIINIFQDKGVRIISNWEELEKGV